jgi:hypothetical protein
VWEASVCPEPTYRRLTQLADTKIKRAQTNAVVIAQMATAIAQTLTAGRQLPGGDRVADPPEAPELPSSA